MSCLLPYQAAVSPGVLLDGRLALFHQEQRWLAVADLHFGYELSQRAAGRLVPLISAPIGAVQNAAATKELGRRAIAYYGGGQARP